LEGRRSPIADRISDDEFKVAKDKALKQVVNTGRAFTSSGIDWLQAAKENTEFPSMTNQTGKKSISQFFSAFQNSNYRQQRCTMQVEGFVAKRLSFLHSD
jgi:hypothetical protein